MKKFLPSILEGGLKRGYSFVKGDSIYLTNKLPYNGFIPGMKVRSQLLIEININRIFYD